MPDDIRIGEQSSFILAEGKRENPFGFWWLLAAGIVVLTAGLLAALIIFLHKPLAIPASPHMMVTASPRAMQSLPDSLKAAMPEEMRRAIDSGSGWPATFGLYRERERWQWFMIAPRWILPEGKTSNGIVQLLASADIDTQNSRDFHYTSTLASALPFRRPLSVEIEPQLLADASGLNINLPDELIRGGFQNGVLLFDTPFESADGKAALHTADIALNMPKNGVTEDAIQDFIRRLSNGRHHHLNVPALSQYHVWLDDLGRPTLTRYDFATELTETDAAQILGAYGFYTRKATLLPDGSLSYEHVAPTTGTAEELFTDHINEQGELVSLKRAELEVSLANETPIAFDAVPACGHTPWMRISDRSLHFILRSIGASQLPETLPDIQIGELNGKLSVCFE